MTILFPCEYDNIKQVDDNYQLEYNACQTLGIDTVLFDHDKFVENGKLKSTIKGDSKILLRSWMLTAKQYIKLNDKLDNKLMTNPWQYKYAHHFPEILQDIKQYTTETRFFKKEDICDELLSVVHSNITADLIIKDYVKSEKGTYFFEIKKDITLPDFKKFVHGFIDARFPLFNEGVVLKEKVELKKDGLNRTNEWRAFYYKGKMISLDRNSNQDEDAIKPQIDIDEIATKIVKSNFFTIDVAEKNDGSWVLLECGDGQVSGLTPVTNELEFYQNLIDNQMNKTISKRSAEVVSKSLNKK